MELQRHIFSITVSNPYSVSELQKWSFYSLSYEYDLNRTIRGTEPHAREFFNGVLHLFVKIPDRESTKFFVKYPC